jgi:hypothetical protein
MSEALGSIPAPKKKKKTKKKKNAHHKKGLVEWLKNKALCSKVLPKKENTSRSKGHEFFLKKIYSKFPVYYIKNRALIQ